MTCSGVVRPRRPKRPHRRTCELFPLLAAGGQRLFVGSFLASVKAIAAQTDRASDHVLNENAVDAPPGALPVKFYFHTILALGLIPASRRPGAHTAGRDNWGGEKMRPAGAASAPSRPTSAPRWPLASSSGQPSSAHIARRLRAKYGRWDTIDSGCRRTTSHRTEQLRGTPHAWTKRLSGTADGRWRGRSRSYEIGTWKVLLGSRM